MKPIQRQRDTFAYRIAAVDQDMLDRLHGEFTAWLPKYPEVDGKRGPIGYWPNIEKFFKARYPAAHKGLLCGKEQAQQVLDGKAPMLLGREQWDGTKYPTGPEAVAEYGYDPAEIAASFVLLHNQSHPLRGPLADADQARLVDIAQKRHKMQQAYEERQKAAARSSDYDDTAWWAAGWDDEDDDDDKPLHKHAMPAVDAYDNNFPQEGRVTEHPHTKGPWFHGTNHKLPVGTILTPGGGETQYEGLYDLPEMANRGKWVWVAPSPGTAERWGEHIYEVEPLDEGPFPWNGDGDGFVQFVSPRARIVRKLYPGEAIRPDKLNRYATERTAMPAPLPDDVTFKYHHTNDSIPEGYSGINQGGSHTFLAPAVAAYKGDKPVAYIEWWPTDKYPNAAKHYRHVMDKGKPGEVYYIYVHPNHRRNSIASEMFRWAKDNVEPDLHHSPKKSELGKKWVSYEESTPELARAAAVIRYAQRVAADDPYPTLDSLAQAGYNTDEWQRWQGGGCLEYAHALMQKFPHLRGGSLYPDDGEFWDYQHHFAHDDEYAYDSAGRHPLPYRGVRNNMNMLLDDDLDSYEDPDPDELAAAHQHIERNGIGPRTAQRVAMPAYDAYDKKPFMVEDERDYAPPDAPPGPYRDNPTGRWYHATPHQLEIGSVLSPEGGERPWSKDLPPGRGDWVWMDSKEGIKDWHDGLIGQMAREYGHDVPIHVYEVTPNEGPYPWNGTGHEGHVAPSATVTAKIPTARIDGWPTIQWAE